VIDLPHHLSVVLLGIQPQEMFRDRTPERAFSSEMPSIASALVAYGYPAFSDEGTSPLVADPFAGTLMQKGGTFVFETTRLKREEYDGFSGAPVIMDGRIIGIVDRDAEAGRLYVISSSALLADEDFRKAAGFSKWKPEIAELRGILIDILSRGIKAGSDTHVGGASRVGTSVIHSGNELCQALAFYLDITDESPRAIAKKLLPDEGTSIEQLAAVQDLFKRPGGEMAAARLRDLRDLLRHVLPFLSEIVKEAPSLAISRTHSSVHDVDVGAVFIVELLLACVQRRAARIIVVGNDLLPKSGIPILEVVSHGGAPEYLIDCTRREVASWMRVVGDPKEDGELSLEAEKQLRHSLPGFWDFGSEERLGSAITARSMEMRRKEKSKRRRWNGDEILPYVIVCVRSADLGEEGGSEGLNVRVGMARRLAARLSAEPDFKDLEFIVAKISDRMAALISQIHVQVRPVLRGDE
jgi:hypothetical protein